MQQPALSRSAVDRSSDARRDAAWLSREWVQGSQVLRLDPALKAPVVGEPERPELVWTATWGDEPPAGSVLLGADAQGAYWAIEVDTAGDTAGGTDGGAAGETAGGGSPGRLAGLLEVGQLLSAHDAGLMTHAVAVLTWHRNHRHCPRCGAATTPAHAGSVRICDQDGSEHFPRVDPAMIVLVHSTDGAQAVLGRAPNWPEGMYSCLAGFVEPGESAEQSVVREVSEEVGLAVHEVRYAGSQPWPFPSSLMLAFTAVADPVTLTPQPAELSDAQWYTRDELRAGLAEGRIWLPPPVSIARGLIDDWLDG